MVGVAIACLLQSGASFLITTSRHVTATTMFQRHQQQPQQAHSPAASRTRTVALAAGAPSTHPQEQSPTTVATAGAAAETAVQPIFLEALLTEADVRKPVRSLAAAKRELLERVGYGTVSPGAERPKSEEERVGYLLEVLEGNYTPIQTVGFFNFAAQVSLVVPSDRLLVCCGCVVRGAW